MVQGAVGGTTGRASNASPNSRVGLRNQLVCPETIKLTERAAQRAAHLDIMLSGLDVSSEPIFEVAHTDLDIIHWDWLHECSELIHQDSIASSYTC